MSYMLDVLRTYWNGSRRLAVVCSLLLALAAASVQGQTYNDLYDFNCAIGTCFPYNFGYLTQGLKGNLFGTSTQTNTFLLGGVFEISRTGGLVANFYDFDGLSDGGFPNGGVTLASDGNFYGTSAADGAFGFGTLYQVTPAQTQNVKHAFTSTEGAPLVAPVEVNNGTTDALYGVTNNGTTYQLTLPKGTYKNFPKKAPGTAFGPLIQAPDGNLYGVTQTGGTNNLGTVFQMTAAGVIKVIHSFSGSDGSSPNGPLTWNLSEITWDKNLYGTTATGGANGSGEIFQVSTTGAFNVLHNFDGYVGGLTCNNDGGSPVAGLTFDSNGLFYGVTSVGGAKCIGTVFDTNTTGGFKKIFDFDESGATPYYGDLAYTTLMKGTDGCFYGLTSSGGKPNGQTNPMGNAYSLCPENTIHIVRVEGPVFVAPGVAVEILGDNLTEAFQVAFNGESAQFSPQADTFLTAQVPTDAVDGFVTVTLESGLQMQTDSPIHILPTITNLDPSSGPVGTQVGVVGGGFVGAKKVTFGGVKASFTVVTPTLIQATVPSGAKTGKVAVKTPNGTAQSKQTFTVN
ncbi:MAG TPA: choice-of-anchor tandem repeat GloVer-containing protein [Terriglobales bacterium]